MILSRGEILAAVRRGGIAITPFNPANVGACSVDLTLSSEFRTFKRGGYARLSEGLDYRKFTTPAVASVARPLKLAPGRLVLGATAERVRLSDRYCAWIQGRSRVARLGLSVHVSSSLVQPGVDNVQVLEVVNNAPFPIALVPGVRVCQLVFEELKGRARYSGAFRTQATP